MTHSARLKCGFKASWFICRTHKTSISFQLFGSHLGIYGDKCLWSQGCSRSNGCNHWQSKCRTSSDQNPSLRWETFLRDLFDLLLSSYAGRKTTWALMTIMLIHIAKIILSQIFQHIKGFFLFTHGINQVEETSDLLTLYKQHWFQYCFYQRYISVVVSFAIIFFSFT